ncbi:conjugal transfer protein, Dtr system, partial [Curtobacterium sp. 20TX0166]|nr:conjugal transfer protein, Dtr system [Curtobacterium allii]
LGRLPSEPWRMFDWHRTAAEVDVLRTKYRIDPSEPQAIPDTLRGNPIADHLQERVTALHKAAALSTAPEVTVSTREHYATHAAERAAAARTALIAAAAAEGVQQATSTAVATASDVVAETSTESAAATTPQASTAEAAPAPTAGTQTTPVASVSPTTAQEGTIMSDPIDDTLENVGRHAGRSGQTITSEAARQIQRANDERRRALQDAQRKADRDREQAADEAQRKAEREKEQADRLERRYPTAGADRQQEATAAAATGAVLSAADADAIDNVTDRDAAAIQSDVRDEMAAETAEIDTTGGEGTETQYDEFELRDREMLHQAGVDPDEVSTSSNAESSLSIDPPAPDLSRGDDGLER